MEVQYQFNEILLMKKFNLDSKKVHMVTQPVENHFRLVKGNDTLHLE